MDMGGLPPLRDGLKITKCRGKKDKNAIERCCVPTPKQVIEAVLRVGRVGDGAEEDAFEIRLGEGGRWEREVCPVTFGQSAATGSGRSPRGKPTYLPSLSAPPAHLDLASVTATLPLFLMAILVERHMRVFPSHPAMNCKLAGESETETAVARLNFSAMRLFPPTNSDSPPRAQMARERRT